VAVGLNGRDARLAHRKGTHITRDRGCWAAQAPRHVLFKNKRTCHRGVVINSECSSVCVDNDAAGDCSVSRSRRQARSKVHITKNKTPI